MKSYSRILFILLFVFCSQNAFSQSVPIDPDVVKGTLKNGLTYIIKENSSPKGRVELRLVVKAGSILENEKQLGLAHFTEHMAFNGTKNFPENELISFLQSAGVEFGADLNAYTSFDETVYFLPLPSDSLPLVETGFEILADWAQGLTFDPEEIDKERGIVIEEWRLGRGAEERMRQKYFPIIFEGSRYADRLPIGTLDVLENFEHKDLIQFYKDWYRTDLLAVIVVGDVKSDWAINQIETHFGKMKKPRRRKAPKREYYDIPDHEGTRVAVASDKEATFNMVSMDFRHPKFTVKTEADYLESLHHQAFSGMLNERFSEIQQQPNSPFIFVGGGFYGTFSPLRSEYGVTAYTPEGEMMNALSIIVRENKRVLEHGFLPSELDRYKKNLLQTYKRAHAEKGKTESGRLIGEFINHFLENEPVPGIDWEYDFIQKNIDNIELEKVNSLAKKWITDDNRSVLLTGKDADGVEFPSEDEILSTIANVESEEVAPYEDSVSGNSLLSENPMAGSIVDSTYLEAIDATKYALSNGIEVFVKSTDFKNDEVMFTAFSDGGTSLYPDSVYFTASNASSLAMESGVSSFSQTDLGKFLAGNSANVSVSVGSTSETIRGTSSPDDLNTMFELLFARITEPRFDEEAMTNFVQKQSALLASISGNPQYAFLDAVQTIMGQGNVRRRFLPTSEDWASLDFAMADSIYSERFADMNNFTFVFVGNIQKSALKPLLEQYVASLPTQEREESFVDLGLRDPSTSIDTVLNFGTEPQSQVRLMYTKEMQTSKREEFLAGLITDALDIILIEEIREKMSGVYGIGASLSTQNRPNEEISLSVNFPCAPENVDKITEAVKKILADVQANGISQVNLDKVKEQRRQRTKVQLQRNQTWMRNIQSYLEDGYDLTEIADWEKTLDSVTLNEINVFANNALDIPTSYRFVRMPQQ